MPWEFPMLRHAVVVLSTLALATGGCDPTAFGDDAGGDATAGPTLDRFVDGTWTLVVDREWNGVTGDLSRPLDEADYQPMPTGPSYTVVVTQGGTRVSITGYTGEPVTGTLASSAILNQLEFNLIGGTDAGGRFLVWAGTDTLQAEYTLYGSVTPFLLSQRGSITQ